MNAREFSIAARRIRKDLEPLGFRVHVDTERRSISISPAPFPPAQSRQQVQSRQEKA